MADELGSNASHYYPENALAKDLPASIEKYPSEKSELIAHFIKKNLLMKEPAISGRMRYWLDPDKWSKFLLDTSQRDNAVVVINELIDLDLNIGRCIDCAEFQGLSSRASFLVKMWRTETIPNVDAFLSYWEPTDRIVTYFHNMTHLMWVRKLSRFLEVEMNHKRYSPEAVGAKRAREHFEKCLG